MLGSYLQKVIPLKGLSAFLFSICYREAAVVVVAVVAAAVVGFVAEAFPSQQRSFLLLNVLKADGK